MNFECVKETGVVSIVRGVKKEELIPLVSALQEGGIKAVEVTCNTPGAIDMINQLRTHFDKEMFVGAGTVLDKETASLVIAAGAQFILSPHLSQEVIEVGNLYGKPVVPGAMTPTEVIQAIRWGAKMVKIFPAGVLGTQYFKNILGPYPHAQMMVVGGVNINNAADFLRAGATSLGTTDLFKAMAEGGTKEVIARSKAYLEIVQRVRQESA
ncbi:bifunctional 4-hydroxy-2-oxoglutarate aldolase/2-dehydro-3-deoxy-phosphogluconate aldolase [Desulfotomaculum sp. 1211_IL3151]|uniref:bifunctional 4-hydroxy-2-oxoglutarate aldolase/2-dehydro-3-deoxy-phosphogluconate aldolase n=1 Tax=Desulfotomaculum sp. 1211_IL3151 TaxID=3084055 RepID=UPI002FDAE765